MRILWFIYGMALGLVLGGFAIHCEQNHKQSVQITEQIVLEVPKNDKEMEKQLLYLSASKAMLEEMHRQKIMRDNEQKTRKR